MPRGQYDRKAKMTDQSAVDTASRREIPDRVEEVKVERRRRRTGDLDQMTVMRLGLPPEVITANEGFELRWVNDEGGRVQHLTQRDDYDVVDGVEGRAVGTTVEGKPLVAVLLRKPKEFAEEDRKAKVDAITARERKVLRSADPSMALATGDEVSTPNAYALPGNTIKGYKP